MKFPTNFYGVAQLLQINMRGMARRGRGIAVHDMLTDGNQENPRRIYCKADNGNITSIQAGECIPFGFHPFIKESEYYPSHNATDFLSLL